ncbi:dehydrogenase/reductase SDR family member 4-like isoform X3 [Gracilinanus agilis]|uniref:dehydrogenase/reductase SDR family member 4-like isoform X3 n=1 Tax=Gracilinanus agilis TaxID=191870 RepID=UPI001CFD05AD|nr:dehydrogenase/reductase SDR family member 4-like isoform X3 [Gracilinanus agilis]
MLRTLLKTTCSQTLKSVSMSTSAAPTSRSHRPLLQDKVALVTASTEGIGFAIAQRLARDGAHVIVSSRKQQNVDRAVAELQKEGLSVRGIVCHVAKAEDRKRLVNTILDINVKSAALLVNVVVPEMVKRGGGSVVFVSSIAAYSPFQYLGPYNVSKTALLGLTKNYASELKPKGIRVNCLAPGLIKTNFSSILWKDEASENAAKNDMKIARLGEPHDCAGIVSFLCSPDADYITGETIVVAGGSPSRL